MELEFNNALTCAKIISEKLNIQDRTNIDTYIDDVLQASEISKSLIMWLEQLGKSIRDVTK